MALSRSIQRPKLAPSYLPVLDFLAPSILQPRRLPLAHRSISTSSQNGSSTSPSPRSSSPLPKTPLTPAQREFLTRALRVNQAGELAATRIYTSQTPPLINAHPSLRPLMAHMLSQESGHLSTFNALLAKHRIRPTALYPIWTVAASVLGWGTGLMGKEAAMACTEAVETEIGEHYNRQVEVLLGMVEEARERGEVLGEELMELVDTVRRIRDEELEHLDHAVENDAKLARPHELLTGVIRAGCRGAIWASERV